MPSSSGRMKKSMSVELTFNPWIANTFAPASNSPGALVKTMSSYTSDCESGAVFVAAEFHCGETGALREATT